MEAWKNLSYCTTTPTEAIFPTSRHLMTTSQDFFIPLLLITQINYIRHHLEWENDLTSSMCFSIKAKLEFLPFEVKLSFIDI
ncbi:CLUMA_CG013901, isoform A [Clunio marinus]|uniref:CLUMA_CG013901, isoform A n=1 Tax=Clunio marinus TaxID=568069 RepID=A0A1J1IQ61_9DIPT|nr:CLUMA_CG013901, isoform A [Clunio marinus]